MDRHGNGLLKVWKQQLVQFKNVSPEIANAICAQYPAPRLLIEVRKEEHFTNRSNNIIFIYGNFQAGLDRQEVSL